MPLDDRGMQALFRELRNPKLETRQYVAAEMRNQVVTAHRGKIKL